jgi:next-to-BRCA1 protein 1
VPKPATVEDEETAPVSPVSPVAAVPVVSQPFNECTTTVNETPSPDNYSEKTIFPGSVAEIQRGFEELLISGRDTQFQSRSTPVCCSQSASSMPPRVNDCSSAETPAPRGTAARDKWFAELASLSAERKSFHSAIPYHNVPVFSVFCNNCQASIPDVHYHCSTCDDGDFDLCQGCIDNGVVCGSEEHWMIKRFVKNGKVINSTTERIPPKEKSAPTVVPTEIQAQDSGLIIATRTCNSCIQGNSRLLEDNILVLILLCRTLRGKLCHLHYLSRLRLVHFMPRR